VAGSIGDYSFHGARLDTRRTVEVLDHLFESNLSLTESGRCAVPICIWGTHGIGKTSVVVEYAKKKGWGFSYCAPAQFEEMGDLHGLPTRVEATDEKEAHTAFLPPDWVPREPGPGILLLDDINRADERILRGLMQLLQNFELFSWRLPPKWQIVATANPEGGDYSVTPMDDAMLTRMMHITMVFDVKAWAAWALSLGIDSRGVDFVLSYPELVSGGRTTPRTLCQFFDSIKGIEDLKANLDLVYVLARSCVDEETAAAFLAFARDEIEHLIAPDEILEAKVFDDVGSRLTELGQPTKETIRLDRLATIASRLVLYLCDSKYKPKKEHEDNLVQFLLHDSLPNELRFSVHQDLINASNPKIVKMAQNRRLAKLVLQGM